MLKYQILNGKNKKALRADLVKEGQSLLLLGHGTLDGRDNRTRL